MSGDWIFIATGQPAASPAARSPPRSRTSVPELETTPPCSSKARASYSHSVPPAPAPAATGSKRVGAARGRCLKRPRSTKARSARTVQVRCMFTTIPASASVAQARADGRVYE